MEMADEKVWSMVLRWSGLSFVRVARRSEGEARAEASWPHLVASALMAGAFFWLFLRIEPTSYADAAEAYKTSAAVYPIYIKFMCLTVVGFLVCGNLRNRKLVKVLRMVLKVMKEVKEVKEEEEEKEKKKSRGVVLGFLALVGLTTGLNLWSDAHLEIHYERMFMVVQYVSCYYMTLFTAHFAITMGFVAWNYKRLNAAFVKLMNSEEGRKKQKKLRIWASASMELRGIEDLINEIFGEQIFFSLILAFSSIIMNGYYFVTLNLYNTSNFWLNLQMFNGFAQSVAVALLITTAAESVTNQANKTNELIFTFSVHRWNWRKFDQMMLTSSAITTVILQCDFLRGSLELSN